MSGAWTSLLWRNRINLLDVEDRNWINSTSTDTNFGIGTIDIRLNLSSSTVLTESSLAQSGLFQTQVYYCDTQDSFLQFHKSDHNLQ